MEITDIKIQPLRKEEIGKVAQIASQSFSGLKEPRKAWQWVNCNFRGFPRMKYFVAKSEEKIVGYILWMEKGGFRNSAVLELEQIAVSPDFRGRGIGTKLIEESFKTICRSLAKRKANLKVVEVTTGTENRAQRLYKKTLGATPEAKITNLFRGDEVIMLARFK